MPVYRTRDLFDLSRTIAAPIFEESDLPWDVLGKISAFILRLGPTLPAERFDHPAEDVWIAKSACVAPSAFIGGPCIVDEEAEVRHCAFIRGSAIVGKGAVVGNSSEVKNSILFDSAQAPHFNYVGDTVMGYKAHFGAGVIATNLKSDQSTVVVKAEGEAADTGRRKLGCLAGDHVEVGCNSAMAPGCVLGRGVTVYPVSFVRGQVPANHIFKDAGHVVRKL